MSWITDETEGPSSHDLNDERFVLISHDSSEILFSSTTLSERESTLVVRTTSPWIFCWTRSILSLSSTVYQRLVQYRWYLDLLNVSDNLNGLQLWILSYNKADPMDLSSSFSFVPGEEIGPFLFTEVCFQFEWDAWQWREVIRCRMCGVLPIKLLGTTAARIFRVVVWGLWEVQDHRIIIGNFHFPTSSGSFHLHLLVNFYIHMTRSIGESFSSALTGLAACSNFICSWHVRPALQEVVCERLRVTSKPFDTTPAWVLKFWFRFFGPSTPLFS